jgi:hypothetical protein
MKQRYGDTEAWTWQNPAMKIYGGIQLKQV